MMFPYPVPEPSDGFDNMEKIFLREMVINLYRNIPNPEDKFIILAVHEMGYTQDSVARMLGTSQVIISTRLKSIKIQLRNQFKKSNLL